jgi:hypothetical protein
MRLPHRRNQACCSGEEPDNRQEPGQRDQHAAHADGQALLELAQVGYGDGTGQANRLWRTSTVSAELTVSVRFMH